MLGLKAYLCKSGSNPSNHQQISKLVLVELKTCLQIILHVVRNVINYFVQ